MSPPAGWSFGSAAEDEFQDVVMQDPPCWTATSAVLRAGRELSSWFFNNLSPPSSPSSYSFFCVKSFAAGNNLYTHTAAANPPGFPTPPSYINKLPQELLDEIFWEYLYGDTAASPSVGNPLHGSFRRIRASSSAKATPFTVAHVCSSWRAAVMSNTSLWSGLCASRPEPGDVPLFEFWLSQSFSRPLDLIIVQKPKMYGDIDIAARHILSLAIAHSARWRSISLYLDQDMESLITDASSFPPVSSLQDIDLDLQGWTTQGALSILGALSRSPCLRNAIWGRSCQCSALSEVSWAGLSTAHFGRINLSDLHPFLNQATTLTTLTIDSLDVDCTPSFLEHCALNPLRLPSVTTLSFIHYNDLAPLFDMLSLPSLSTLGLRRGMGAVASWAPGWSSLYNLVQRSGCQIRSLTWSHYRLPEPTFIAAFTEASSTIFPHLSHLNVTSAVGNDAVWAFNLASAPGGPIFGRLQYLEMEDCRAEFAVLEDMLESRPCLERASVELYDQPGSMKRIVWTPQC